MGQIPQTAPSAVIPLLLCNNDWVAKPAQIWFLNFSLKPQNRLCQIFWNSHKSLHFFQIFNTKYKSLVNNLILIYHSIIFEVTKTQWSCLVAMHFVMLAFLRSVVWPHFWSTVLHIQQNTEVETKKYFSKTDFWVEFYSHLTLGIKTPPLRSDYTETLCSKSEVILQVRQIDMTVTEVRPNMSVRPKCPYCRDMFALCAAQPPLRPRS